jgi:hypothetical protein
MQPLLRFVGVPSVSQSFAVVSMVGVVWCDPLHHTTLECMVWCGVVPLVPHGAL